MKPFIIGIAGGTASGKTTLAAKLLEVGGQEIDIAYDKRLSAQSKTVGFSRF
jgi:uridine kinase